MQKGNDSVDLAKKMIKDLEANWLSHLEDLNLHTVFRPIYSHNLTILNLNAIVAFVILAYTEESAWINPRKDRFINKEEILSGIGVDPKNKIYKEILYYENDHIQQVVLNYLLFQTDHRFQEIISLLEYADKTLLFCNQKTVDKEPRGTTKTEEKGEITIYEYLDQAEVSKISREKGDLLFKALDARKRAEEMLKQLENDFQKTDHATGSDYGFLFSDPKKFNITSWEHRVKRRKESSL
jgi:hypothetical protein